MSICQQWQHGTVEHLSQKGSLGSTLDFTFGHSRDFAGRKSDSMSPPQAIMRSETQSKHQPGRMQAHSRLHGRVLVGSQTGTCSALGASLVSAAAQQNISLELQNLLDYEPEQLLQEKLVLLVVSTYEDGTPPTSAKCVPAGCALPDNPFMAHGHD